MLGTFVSTKKKLKYNPVRVGNFWSNNYTEYKNSLLTEEYFNNIILLYYSYKIS